MITPNPINSERDNFSSFVKIIISSYFGLVKEIETETDVTIVNKSHG